MKYIKFEDIGNEMVYIDGRGCDYPLNRNDFLRLFYKLFEKNYKAFEQLEKENNIGFCKEDKIEDSIQYAYETILPVKIPDGYEIGLFKLLRNILQQHGQKVLEKQLWNLAKKMLDWEDYQ